MSSLVLTQQEIIDVMEVEEIRQKRQKRLREKNKERLELVEKSRLRRHRVRASETGIQTYDSRLFDGAIFADSEPTQNNPTVDSEQDWKFYLEIISM